MGRLCCFLNNMTQEEEVVKEKEGAREEKGEKQTSKEKTLSPLMMDEYSTIRLRNGKKLVVSSVDAIQLGTWVCDEKRHNKCKCKRLAKYGTATVVSEFYVRSKRTRIVFE